MMAKKSSQEAAVKTKKLHKALSIYECAVLDMDTDAFQLSMFEQMGLVNNMGHIHSLLDNTKHSQDCFEHLTFFAQPF
jgi:hypothetical protein